MQLTFSLISSPHLLFLLLDCCPQASTCGLSLTASGALPAALIRQDRTHASPWGRVPLYCPGISGPPSHAPELLRSSPPPSPTPAWTCPFLPGSCHTAVLGGSVVMHRSLSSKLPLPHSRDRAFSSFYLQLLFYVGSCCPPLTKSVTFSQMLVERKGAFNQDAGHLGRGRAEHLLETPLRSCLAMNVLKGRRGVISVNH